ncbi:hypothetical protein V8G54_011227 [Vigna mungo]|uniref:Uncharacterized protein n=1 Tax=Vigna mungo TaxID=3915 RepID=A0AAQ3NP98_VIGMU
MFTVSSSTCCWPCFIQPRISLSWPWSTLQFVAPDLMFMWWPLFSLCQPVLSFNFCLSVFLFPLHGACVKQINVKSKHDDRDGGSCFVMLKGNNVNTNSAMEVSMSIKAISIQAVSQRMFLILDSHGDLHLLSLSNSGIGVDVTGNVRPLSRTMKVKSVAVLPDLSSSNESGEEGLAGSGDRRAVKAAVAVGCSNCPLSSSPCFFRHFLSATASCYAKSTLLWQQSYALPQHHGVGDVGFSWWPITAALGVMEWRCRVDMALVAKWHEGVAATAFVTNKGILETMESAQLFSFRKGIGPNKPCPNLTLQQNVDLGYPTHVEPTSRPSLLCTPTSAHTIAATSADADAATAASVASAAATSIDATASPP